METPLTPLERLVRLISKMFLVLVMAFGSPPVVTIWEQRRRPIVALVMSVRRSAERGWPDARPLDPPAPPAWAAPVDQGDRPEDGYIPVRAA